MTLFALMLGALVVPVSPATAAPGDAAQLYLGASYEGTTIGSDKDFNNPTECPANSLLVGVRTENRLDAAPNNANAILVRLSLQCATITVSNAGAITGTVNPTWINGPTWDQGRGNLETASCPANTYVHRITGTTFVGNGVNRWPSSVQITCRPLIHTAAGEIRVNLSATPTVLTAGEDFNTTGGLATPPPQCGPGATTGTSDILVRGYRAQGGGEGMDGFTPSCTTIADDFGDAPASYGSASQELNAATYLGWSADPETAMQSNANAAGDDAVGGTSPNLAIDDETGVSAFGEIIAGVTGSYSVSVLASNKLSLPATLVGWVDFNRNGVFEAVEGASVVVPARTPDGSSFTLSWSGIAPRTVAGQSYARFRIGAGSNLTTSTPTGSGAPGEVEDYALSITAAAPVLELTKTATPTTITAAGQTVTYTFDLANTGNVAISDIGISETAFSGTGTPGPITCAATALSVGESTTCSATYVATQADVDAGTLTNTALAAGTAADGSAVASTPSSAVVAVTQSTSLTVLKSATPSGPDDFVAGQVIDYSFVVTNTGNVTVTDVSIDETAFDGSGSLSPAVCPTAPLPPGEQTTCTASYTLTQADVDSGAVNNTATATGVPPGTLAPPVSPPSTVRVPVDPAPAITVEKSADTTAITGPGQTIEYSFLVTNTGNVTLSDVTVDEGSFSGTGPLDVTCPAAAASLAPGEEVTCTATYTVTAEDYNTSELSNTATATGTPADGTPPVSPPSTVEIPVTPAPGLTLAKSADLTEIGAAGETITYSFLITNTGNVTLADVGVDEVSFSGTGTAPVVTCPAAAASLAPGDTVTCTAPYVVTQADVDAGGVTNTATGTGTPPGGGAPPVSPPSTVEVPSVESPAITVVKSADPVSVSAAGTTVEYSFLVTNTGNVTLTGVSVTETVFTGAGTPPVVTCPAEAASLAPSADVTCTASYTTTQADIDAGQITNTATVTGTPPSGDPVVSSPTTAIVTVPSTPALTLVKSADVTSISAAGETITYSFLITNTGNVTLADVGVTEVSFSGTGTSPIVTCPAAAASLAPGADVTCTAEYTVTQADVDAGGVSNTATVTGDPPGGGEPPVSPPSSVDVPSVVEPGLSVVKSASPDSAADFVVGQEITYAFVVTNTGTVTLTDVVVNETAFSGAGAMSAISCPAGAASLAPGGQVECSATYTLTQADVDAGQLSNSATATGTPPSGDPVVSTPSTVELPGDPQPGLSVVKSADRSSISAAGETITYSFLVTNTGNVTITDVSVTETAFTGTGTAPIAECPAGPVAPGGQVTCTAEYTVTQADVDAGGVSNTATVTGDPPGGGTPPVSPPSTVDVPSEPEPGLSVVKSADRSSISAAGQTITYSFLVTNTGNTTITDVSVTETAFSGTGAAPVAECPAGPVAPGADVTCTAEYVVTQADVDAGGVSNTATVTGDPPGGGTPPVSPPSTVDVPSESEPGLSVVKSADVTSISAAGETITYSFLVTNIGNTTITDVSVTETAFSGTGAAPVAECPAGPVAPGADVTCTAEYTVTQADVDAGGVANTATVTGDPPGGGTPPVSPPSTVDVPSESEPGLSVVKSADATSITTAGQTITYSFLVTNTGNVTITDPSVTETAFTGTGTAPVAECPAGPVAPGAQVTCTAEYTVTQADVDAGGVSNTATVTGDPPGGGTPPVSPPSTVDVPSESEPGLSVAKTADVTSISAAGETITYSFLVTNTGNVTITDVSVTETAFTGTGTAPVAECPAGPVAPGADVTCTAEYTVTQADVDAGGVSNTATVTGDPPGGGEPPVSPPSTVVVTGERTPAITAVKSASPDAPDAYRAGQEITYSFVVTNAGNVTLTDVGVDEGAFSGSGTLSAIVCPADAASMAPGAQIICTATYELTQADIDAGQVTNSATATGTPPGGLAPPVSPPSEARVPALPAPDLSIVKSATPATMSTVGQVLQYDFVVTNTGNVTLTEVMVDEGAFSGTGEPSSVECPAEASSMVPGQTVTCSASYVTTQADVDSGALTNTATATGTPPEGAEPPVSPPSTVQVPFDGTNSLDIEKRAVPVDANSDGRTDPGDRVEWTITVENTGAQTVDDIVVSDPTAGPVTCPATSLASGEKMTCTVPAHTIDQDDVRRGGVSNVATATGETPSGPVDPPSSQTFTRVLAPPPSGLAVTGGTLAAGALLVGGLMILAGLGLGLSRTLRRREQEKQ